MLLSITEVDFSAVQTAITVQCDVVIIQLHTETSSFADQIKYLQEIQTPVLVHRELVVHPDLVREVTGAPGLLGKIFIVGRDVAALFRLHHDFTMVAEATVWLIPKSAAAEAQLNN